MAGNGAVIYITAARGLHHQTLTYMSLRTDGGDQRQDNPGVQVTWKYLGSDQGRHHRETHPEMPADVSGPRPVSDGSGLQVGGIH